MTQADLVQRLKGALLANGNASSDFDLNSDTALPKPRKLSSAAVLICFRPNGYVILTKRSAKLRNHPGQIAFPGGRQDPEDESLIATALREAQEEIGLPSSTVKILGTLPRHETVTGFDVLPVVGLLTDSFVPVPEAGEVAEVFDVPMAHLTTARNFQIQSRNWQGTQRYYYVVPYGPYYIWGATARILRSLAEGFEQ